MQKYGVFLYKKIQFLIAVGMILMQTHIFFAIFWNWQTASPDQYSSGISRWNNVENELDAHKVHIIESARVPRKIKIVRELRHADVGKNLHGTRSLKPVNTEKAHGKDNVNKFTVRVTSIETVLLFACGYEL